MACSVIVLSSCELNKTEHSESHLADLGSKCGYPANCAHIAGADCIADKCQCVDGLLEEDGQCVLGGPCNKLHKCPRLGGSVCVEGKCACPEKHFLKNKNCTRTVFLGDSCHGPGDCFSYKGMQLQRTMDCENKSCVCLKEFVAKQGVCVNKAGASRHVLNFLTACMIELMIIYFVM